MIFLKTVCLPLQVSSQLEMWAEELQHSELTRDMQQAEQLLRLHNESVTQMQNTTFQVNILLPLN